jgi:hypothetical protein
MAAFLILIGEAAFLMERRSFCIGTLIRITGIFFFQIANNI